MSAKTELLWKPLLAVLVLGIAGVSRAADYFVAPSGPGGGGTNWATAFGNVQDAATLATNAGDTIYLQWGVYSNASQVVISNALGLTVVGGCVGGGSEAYSGTNSTLTRAGGVMRIVYACDSVVTLSGLTIAGGYFNDGAHNGAGLCFTNCVATLTNCVVGDNKNNSSTATFYGGGVYAEGGSLTIVDSAFFNNEIHGFTGGGVYVYGGAIAAVGCPLTVRGSGCVFSNNVASTADKSNIAYGGAIYTTNALLRLENALLVNNLARSWSRGGTLGGALYCAGGGMSATIADCRFFGNAATNYSAMAACGGAICLAGSAGVITNCAFASNNVASSSAWRQGGGIYAADMESLLIVSNVFQDNWVDGGGTVARGASFAVSNCADALVENCVLDGATTVAGTAPELVYVCRGGSTRFLDTVVGYNRSGRGVCFAGAAGSKLGMTNCLVVANNGNGVAISNGAASLFNCILARNIGDGLGMAAGTATVANCTLADNAGLGFSRTGGTGAVVNSIAWGNLSGGILSNENVWVDYSCVQAPVFGGENNLTNEPLFAPVAGCYYLSVSGLTGQAASSPCLDRGNDTAENLGLANRTTCTSGTHDSDRVDLGYHYANGTSAIRTITACYVDANHGDNANSGASWDLAWKSLTHALSNVAANATIHLATGAYNAGIGETFPLNVQMPGLTLAASNSNPALTVLDNAGTNGQRVLQASGMGTVVLRGLTFRGGRFAEGDHCGAGLLFQGCLATLTNCAVMDNTNICTMGTTYGGGIFAAGGSLTLLDTVVSNNALLPDGVIGCGGGVAAVNCAVIARGSRGVFRGNTVSPFGLREDFYGGALYANGSDLTLDGVTFHGNGCHTWTYHSCYGGGVYHVGKGAMATVTGCRFEGQYAVASASSWGDAHGGALYLGGSTGIVTGCLFTNNYTATSARAADIGYAARGGGVYAAGLQRLQLGSNTFQTHWVDAFDKQGAALFLDACVTAVVEGCTIDVGGVSTGTAPELVYVSGGGSTLFLDSTLRDNRVGGGLYFSGAAGSTLGMTNCAILGNTGNGLVVSNGRARVFNCLLAQNGGDGLGLAAGTVAVANCTLAENVGWGFNREGGTGTVLSSIAWGNGAGGILSNANVWVDYSCLQTPAFGGTNNLELDPLFANVSGCYYLSSNGLPHQTVSSPCIDAGSNAAASWGLDTRTTCTSGTNDAGPVDLGYHYANGVDDAIIRWVTNCYVDAVGGNDMNAGTTWGTAWRTLTKALSNVTANATIHVATGTYSWASNGEEFPLTVPMANLTLAASNGDASLTVLDNAGTNGQRVLQATSKGALVLRGLTFRGGSFTNGWNFGAGLKLLGCAATLTNCAVMDNTNICTTGEGYGGGIYAAGGSLTLLDTVVSNNALRLVGVTGYGGGVAAIGCPFVARGRAGVFHKNTVATLSDWRNYYGGAIYVLGGALTLDGVRCIANGCATASYKSAFGGAVYHAGTGVMAVVNACWFDGNYAFASSTSGGDGHGGALCLEGSTGMVTGCLFTNNQTRASDDPLDTGYARGGGVCAAGLQCLQLVSNTFQKHWMRAVDKQGGAIYINACANTRMESCAIDGGGISTGAAPELVYVTGEGSTRCVNSILRNNSAGRGLDFAGAAGATLEMSNCMVANNDGDGVLVSDQPATLVNCTLANNAGWGIARPTSAALTVKNSILWGNALGGIGHNQNLILAYTDSQDGWAACLGAGNFSADPLFVNPAAGDYHEMGKEGSCHDGAWTPDGANSPCLDAGDPGSDWSLEPKPCGNRINIGAYGNTAEATRSLPPVGMVISVR